MSGCESAGPLKRMCDISSVGTLTCVKSVEMVCESVFATISEQFAIVDHFFLFWCGRLG
jgi:hypothetical protein